MQNITKQIRQMQRKNNQAAVRNVMSATKRDLARSSAQSTRNKILQERLDAAKKLNSEMIKTQKLKAELARYNTGKISSLTQSFKNEIKNFKKNNPSTYKLIKKAFG